MEMFSQLTAMSAADLAFGLLVLSSLILGIIRGLIREVLSLGSWILAAWLSYRYGLILGDSFDSVIKNPTLSAVIGSVVVFAGVLIALTLLSSLLNRVFKKAGLSLADRFFGGIFGVARGAAVITVLLIAFRLTSIPEQDWYVRSQFIPYFNPLVNSFSLKVSDSLSKDAVSTSVDESEIDQDL
ncbi:CvpA family protein [Arenicellales bacterium nBUS_48]